MKPYFYGISIESKLTFPISFMSEDEITALDASTIQNWLFGETGYRQFSFVQEDMDYVYLNCIFKEPRMIRAGNVICGFECTCEADSEFAWTYPKLVEYGPQTTDFTITFYNDSHYKGYLYPSLEFQVNTVGAGTLSITNANDDDRLFELSDLVAGETITVNNELGILSTSRNVAILGNFNKNFLRLVPGLNVLSVTREGAGGGFSSFILGYQFARRIGG